MEAEPVSERCLLSPLTPLTKGGKPMRSSIEGSKPKIPLIKGDTGGFDKGLLKERGLIITGFHLPYNPALTEVARKLRKDPTPAEKKIWHDYLSTLKYRVLRQRPIDNYIVDFYCREYKLVVEIDGDSHFTEAGKSYDEERTETLEQYRLKVIRFLNDDVLNNLDGVVFRIEDIVQELRGAG